MQLLTGVSTTSVSGDFQLTVPAGRMADDAECRDSLPNEADSARTAVGVEFFSEPVRLAATEPSAAEPSAAVEADMHVPVMSEENRLLIREALRISLNSDLQESGPPVLSGPLAPPLPFNAAAEAWQDGSLVFEEYHVPVNEPTASQPEVTHAGLDRDNSNSKSGNPVSPTVDRMFTIPVDLHSLEWDLRSSIVEFPEVMPLAESVDSLRNEVSDFHAGLRGAAESESTASDHSDQTDNSSLNLLGQARRRLYGDPVPSASSDTDDAAILTEADPVSSSSESNGDAGRFTTLFPRLRSMRTYRKDVIE